MDSTQIKHTLSDMVFDIKEKITDEEYKNIMDGIKKINEKKFIRIYYNSFIAGIDYDNDDDELVESRVYRQGEDSEVFIS